ncbi:hypothetical protein AVEN_109028-1 [Araneus ventricosus]|uniref:DUF4817 domain-containing protein n=1 Tax=Araneus ventricosus TaxID=182803 RepID=A0A4Y2HMW8_ARAVE|nr:hypothetical protein AVEN_109028-1 [Araneus ventricosus]
MATVQEKAMCALWFFETKSVITTQRRFRTTYKKDPPSDNSIRLWLTQFQETGSVLHRKGAGDSQSTKINETSSCAVTYTTIWNVLHNRLQLNAYKVQIAQALHFNIINKIL